MNKETEENALLMRRKVFYLSPDALLAFLSGKLNQQEYVVVPKCLNLPETAIIRSVHYEWSRNAFALVVIDESFPVVQDGLRSPELSMIWSTQRIFVEHK